MIPKCKKCLLFDKKNGLCDVKVLIEGVTQQIPVQPNDECFWIKIDLEVGRALKEAIKSSPFQEVKQKLIEQDTPIEIKSIRVWSDGKNGFVEEKG